MSLQSLPRDMLGRISDLVDYRNAGSLVLATRTREPPPSPGRRTQLETDMETMLRPRATAWDRSGRSTLIRGSVRVRGPDGSLVDTHHSWEADPATRESARAAWNLRAREDEVRQLARVLRWMQAEPRTPLKKPDNWRQHRDPIAGLQYPPARERRRGGKQSELTVSYVVLDQGRGPHIRIDHSFADVGSRVRSSMYVRVGDTGRLAIVHRHPDIPAARYDELVAAYEACTRLHKFMDRHLSAPLW